ncbi:MAG: hypothetical protein V4493_04325 [Pseudomonadota bacterium]
MSYKGKLNYIDYEDVLSFDSFIIKGDCITFHATTTWGKWGEWVIESDAIFNGKYYETNKAYSSLVLNTNNMVSCKVVFSEVTVLGSEVKVAGYWDEKDEKHNFSGTLERKD